MIGGSLSRRYAKALFELAVAQRREEEIGQEVESFAGAYKDPALNRVLNNPAFGVESRRKIVAEIARNLQLSPLVIHFLSLLVERGRLNFFPAIVERYRRLLDEKKGQAQARVIAASPVDDGDFNKLRAALEKISGKRVVIHQENDPTLIGGIVIHLEGKIYDGSVRSQLESMKQRIERGY